MILKKLASWGRTNKDEEEADTPKRKQKEKIQLS